MSLTNEFVLANGTIVETIADTTKKKELELHVSTYIVHYGGSEYAIEVYSVDDMSSVAINPESIATRMADTQIDGNLSRVFDDEDDDDYDYGGVTHYY